MKKIYLFLFAALIFAACNKDIEDSKKFVFNVNGDFTVTTDSFNSKSGISSDDACINKLWVFDYKNGSYVQEVYQFRSSSNPNSNPNFGRPELTLTPGTHHLYFIASNSLTPYYSTALGIMQFVEVYDTFWKDLEVEVTSSTIPTEINVNLDRIVTKLRCMLTDTIPSNASTISITPHHWYYGFNFKTGNPVDVQTDLPLTINIPSSSIGQTNTSFEIYSLSPSTEWNTDVNIQVKTADGSLLGSAGVESVPFMVNRTTVLSGDIFNPSSDYINLNSTWQSDFTISL